jgi:transposase
VFNERTSVGLDVHARSVVARGIDGQTGEVFKARLCPQPREVLGWLHQLPGPVAVAYEAGPTGFGLARAIRADGLRCEVAAPSKLHRPSGDRIKTDARDALHLARLLRLDDIAAVRVPTAEEEAARDLVRAREDVRGDLMRARLQVTALLLRQGILYDGGQPWTLVHRAWLRRQRFEDHSLQIAYEAGLAAVFAAEDRRRLLDNGIAQAAQLERWSGVVTRLQCLRGISTVTAFALAVEIGDWDRFTGASIGAFVGLVPSEHSSGQTRSQGPITKSGNGHVRRLLIESAWNHRRSYRSPSTTMRRRWGAASPAAAARGHAGNRRLHERWLSFAERNKKPVIANVAIARELAGWCWSLATLD